MAHLFIHATIEEGHLQLEWLTGRLSFTSCKRILM